MLFTLKRMKLICSLNIPNPRKFLRRLVFRLASPFSNNVRVLRDVDHRLISRENLTAVELLRKTRLEVCMLEQDRLRLRALRYSDYQAELISRSNERKVLLLLTNDKFIRSALASKRLGTSLWYPIPWRWHKTFTANSFKINRYFSLVMYLVVVVYLEVRNLIRIVASILSQARFTSSEWFLDFSWLSCSGAILARKNNPLLTLKEVDTENFAAWMMKEFKYELNSESLSKQSDQMRFGLYRRVRTILQIAISTRFFVPGIWKYVKYVDISELILYEITKKQAKNSNIEILLFDNSQRNSKPIWVKALESGGVRVCLFFYSTEDEPLFENGSTPRIDFWLFSKWNEIWYVNARQRDRILMSLGYQPSRFLDVGLPWWVDNGFRLPNKTKGVLSLFSLEPLKNDLTLNPGLYQGLGRIEVSQEVLQMALQICKELNLELWHKPKRNISNTRVPDYARFLQKLAETESHNYKEIHPEISSSRLIKSSNLVVSVPCTSTALEARSLDIPSAFFIPINDFEIALDLRSDVPLLRSYQEFRVWIASNLPSNF